MFRLSLVFILKWGWASQLVVWNVGQGQWVSEVRSDVCLHYDLGGEKNPSSAVLALCQGKKNILHISHWDWDHLSFAASFARQSHNSCLLGLPLGEASESKKRGLGSIPLCADEVVRQSQQSLWKKIFKPWRMSAKSNDLSEVVYSQKFKALIPGDSPKNQERLWFSSAPSESRLLVLGHHGSRTSTSPLLLAQLSSLRMAIATARKARYGHPHREVVQALRERGIPLLRTEDWGNLHFFDGD